MRDKLKVVVVGGFPPPSLKVFGGIVTSCKMLLESSFKDHFDLVLIDSTQVSNPPPGFLERLRFAISRFFHYLKKLRTEKPDAVLLFASRGASLVEKGCMCWIARAFGVPALIFPRGGGLIQDADRSRWNLFWIRHALKGASFFLCQGPSWQRFAIDRIGFSSDRVALVPNWTATSIMLQIGQERTQKQEDKLLQILFVGWLEKEKGIFELLEATRVLSSTQDFRLVIAGRGRAEQQARDFVKDHGLSGVVEFAGWVEGDSLCDLLKQSEVFALPSWSEGLPNAMIEAMAAGLAVVVSSVGNIPDIITDEKEALLVPPKDVEALCIALRRTLESSILRNDLSRTGHAFALTSYSVETAVQKLTDAINQAVSKA